MAVFTDITTPQYQNQLSEIESAYNITIASIEGIPLGSSDSMFKVQTREHDSPLVLTIHETPDVTPAGLTSKAARRVLHFVDFLAEAAESVHDRFGKPVRLTILKPLKAYPRTAEEVPFAELSFDGVKKIVSIVPFVKGKSYTNSPEELAEPDEAFRAGRALGAYRTLAQSYLKRHLFDEYDFDHCVQEVTRISEDKAALEKLGFVLSDCNQEGVRAENIGREYLSEMKDSGEYLLDSWRRISKERPLFPRILIHGDMFTDNVLIEDNGRIVLLDFNEIEYTSAGIDIGVAISSWASQDGNPVLLNALRFLQGYDSVIALTGEQLSQIPTFTQIGSFRWETFRVQRIEMQDPRQRAMHTPAEFQRVRHGWRDLQGLFNALQSVDDLAARMDIGESG
jgi:Ser/Thr protein kinase RdoA (MazF antagonist)